MSRDTHSAVPDGPRPVPEHAMDGGAAGILDPQLALQMMAGTDEAVRKSLAVNTAGIYGAWGLAWLVGYLCYALSLREDDTPAAWAGWVLAACLIAAGVVTALLISRASRGVRGASNRIGMMVGASWTLGFMSVYTLVGAFVGQAKVFDQHASLAIKLYALVAILLVGLIYLVQGSVLGDGLLFGGGVWIVLVATAAMIAQPVAVSYAIVAIAGGGGLLIAGVISARRQKKERARVY